VLFRHVFAIAVLPATVTLAVPIWLARRSGARVHAPGDPAGAASLAAGVLLLAIGLALFAASLRHFATRGRGTLAPWDPPKRLVISGPYRYVRNPMISGVISILLGEALVLRSLPHLWWAATFLAINATYIPLFEEPQLEWRFGDDYRRYCRHVGRLVPRLRPWNPGD
jgi:protein-S-isoprenylcysteine O-methyltransferase Ste14